jgi:hypothetical protein
MDHQTNDNFKDLILAALAAFRLLPYCEAALSTGRALWVRLKRKMK